MTEEEARKLLRTLNNAELSYPTGPEAEGFQIDGWNFDYEGSGKWVLRAHMHGVWVNFVD